jgi:hypothetical protein
MRDDVPSFESAHLGDGPDRFELAVWRPRGSVAGFVSRIRQRRVLINREATKMIASVTVLLLGIVIMSAIGSFFGYLLEPGRFTTREAGETAVRSAAANAEANSGSQTPRLAA